MNAANNQDIAYVLSNVTGFKGHEGEPLVQGKMRNASNKVVCTWSEDSHGGCLSWHFTSKEEESKFVNWSKNTYLAGKTLYGKPYETEGASVWQLAEWAMSNMVIEYQERKEDIKATKDHALAYTFVKVDHGPDVPFLMPQVFKFKELLYCAEDVDYARKNVEVPKGAELVFLNERVGQTLLSQAEVVARRENKRFKLKCKTMTLIKLKDETGKVVVFTFPSPYSPHVAQHLKNRHGDNLVEIINERFV